MSASLWGMMYNTLSPQRMHAGSAKLTHARYAFSCYAASTQLWRVLGVTLCSVPDVTHKLRMPIRAFAVGLGLR